MKDDVVSMIKTYSGKSFDVANPNPKSIDIRDIAHALSFICRGCGQVSFFFPVARHCVNCAREALARGFSPKAALACLLHDAAEAYMSDIPSPVKRLLPQYEVFEKAVLNCVYTKYLGHSLTAELSRAVDLIDKLMLSYDLKYLLNVEPLNGLPELKTEISYEFIPFIEAEKEYLATFNELISKLNQDDNGQMNSMVSSNSLKE